MNKSLVTLIAGLFASAAFAQAPAPAAVTAPGAPAKAVQADVKTAKPAAAKADAAHVAAGAQGGTTVKTTPHPAIDKTHLTASHPTAKTNPAQTKADTKETAPK